MKYLKHSIALLVLTQLFVLNSCNSLGTSDELINHIPDQTELLIRLQKGTSFQEQSSHMKRFSSFKEFNSVQEQLRVLKGYNPTNEGLLSFVEIEKDKFDFILIKKYQEALPILSDSIASLSYDGQEIHSRSFEKATLYSWSNQNHHFLSSSQLLIENSIRNYNRIKEDHELINLFNKSSQNNVFIRADNNSWLSKKIHIAASQPKNSGSWIALESESNSNQTKAHGLTTLNDSIEHFLYMFEGQKPIRLISSKYAPYTTDGLWSFGLSDFEQYDLKRDQYLGKKHKTDSLFSSLSEFALLRFNNQSVHLFRALYADQLFEQFSTNPINYQGVTISEFNADEFQEHFYPLLDLKEDTYSCLIDDILLSSKSQEALKTLISSYNTKSTYDKSASFKTATTDLAKESNINYIGKLSEVVTLEDGSDEVFSLQWVSDKNFFHTHMSLKGLDSLPTSKQIAPLFSVKLEAPIRLGPFVVTNHRTGLKELIAQDQNNQLYLIDHKGSILWKKQLTSSINERIHQVDLYRNKRLQFAFTTEDQLIVLDRNGKEVQDFIKTFKDGALGPLAIFDYDNSRQYRMVFSQGRSIYMLNSKGNNVKGFNYSKAAAPLIEVPKHFRINNKDYLVFKLANGGLKILNRRGSTRIETPSHYDYSSNEIYAFQGHFVFTDKEGALHFIDQDGKEVLQNLAIGSEHLIDVHEDGILSLSESQLKFRDKTYTLPFGSYGAVKILEFNSTIFITTTDKDTNQLYLFDSNLQLLDQFPVFGFSTAEMADLNKDGTAEIITQDGPDGIIVYSGL